MLVDWKQKHIIELIGDGSTWSDIVHDLDVNETDIRQALAQHIEEENRNPSMHNVITINGWHITYRNRDTVDRFKVYSADHHNTGLTLDVPVSVDDCDGTTFLAFLNKINSL